MIRVVTLDEFEEADINEVCKFLFQAYGLGCETAGELPLPDEARSTDEKGSYDAATLLAEAETVKLVADDKLVYITRQKLVQPEGPLGRPPTHGHADFGGQRAVVSTALFPKAVLEPLSEEFRKRLAKQAVREVGTMWELHTCLDPKCSMHPAWAEGFQNNVEPVLCTFCREKSEERIRLAKT